MTHVREDPNGLYGICVLQCCLLIMFIFAVIFIPTKDSFIDIILFIPLACIGCCMNAGFAMMPKKQELICDKKMGLIVLNTTLIDGHKNTYTRQLNDLKDIRCHKHIQETKKNG